MKDTDAGTHMLSSMTPVMTACCHTMRPEQNPGASIACSTHIEPAYSRSMAACCICKINAGTTKIKDGNPKYRGRPICKECQTYRRLLQETR